MPRICPFIRDPEDRFLTVFFKLSLNRLGLVLPFSSSGSAVPAHPQLPPSVSFATEMSFPQDLILTIWVPMSPFFVPLLNWFIHPSIHLPAIGTLTTSTSTRNPPCLLILCLFLLEVLCSFFFFWSNSYPAVTEEYQTLNLLHLALTFISQRPILRNLLLRSTRGWIRSFLFLFSISLHRQ